LKLLFLGLLFGSFSLFAQDRVISGTVVDNTKQPIPGASIVIKGKTVGTATDINGKFSLKVTEGQTLIISSVGYASQEALVTTAATIDVVLAEDVQELSEVVVIGYGVQKKSDVTGAVTSVNKDDLLKAPAPNLTTALQGKAAGVQIGASSGAPGASTQIRIRGISSFSGNDPLWIVDGVPTSANSINMSDVETIEILKDASTSAIYGSAGANGVVLIGTKKGKEGKMQFTFNSYYGFQEVTKTLDLASGPENAHMRNMYENIAGLPKKLRTFKSADPIAEINALPTYDYQDLLFQTAPIQSYDFSVSGGSGKFTSYFGASYLQQDGIILNTDYNKLSLRSNGEYKVREWFKVGANLSYTKEQRNGYEEWILNDEYQSPIINAYKFSSYIAPRDTLGEWGKDKFDNANPLYRNETYTHYTANNNEGKSTVYASIQPIKNLTVESKLTGSLSFSDQTQFTPGHNITSTDNVPLNQVVKQNNIYRGWNWQNIATYNQTFYESINMSVMAGLESSYGKSEWIGGRRHNLFNDTEVMWYPNASQDNTTTDQFIQGSGDETAGWAYFGRLSLDYKSKYLLQGNLRHDASSKFGPDKRSGYFPGFSVGWKFSEEEFMKNIDWLSLGKIRYGWGEAGVNNVASYDYYATVAAQNVYSYSFNNSASGSTTGAAPNKLVNPAIAWETVRTTDLGLDLAFFNNRLSLTADYFTRQNIGLLVMVPVPGYAGWTVRDTYNEGGNATASSNAGSLKNSGIELTMGWKEKLGDFDYSIDGNFTYLKNEVDDLKGNKMVGQGGKSQSRGVSGNITEGREGYGIGDFFGYKVDHLMMPGETAPTWQPKAQPGDFIWKKYDMANLTTMTDNDRVSLGNPHAKYTAGLNVNLRYKIVDFSMFWQSAFGFQIFKAYLANMAENGINGATNVTKEMYDGLYRPQIVDKTGAVIYEAHTTGATYPRYDKDNVNNNYSTISDFYIEDGDYLKLKNIQVGITIPQSLLAKSGIEKLRFYVGVKNALTFTKYSGLDPELNNSDPLASGIDRGPYPSARIYTVGVNLNF
jgi:TonB-linked SusC/RagA family outer membrane protein